MIPRLKAMLGDAVKFELEWVSIYTFQGRRMESFRHHRVIFAGDSAHQVSPFGARGANSGVQDTNNLGWKLKAVINGIVSDALIDSYNIERVCAAEENIRHSTQSTNFITPKLAASRIFRDAVLNLAEQYPFAQPLVNSSRLSLPCVYDHSPLITPDALHGPSRSRPGAPCCDVALQNGYLLQQLRGGFALLWINIAPPNTVQDLFPTIGMVALRTGDDPSGALQDRYLGTADRSVYLIRPDQHLAARWSGFDPTAVHHAHQRALAKEPEAWR